MAIARGAWSSRRWNSLAFAANTITTILFFDESQQPGRDGSCLPALGRGNVEFGLGLSAPSRRHRGRRRGGWPNQVGDGYRRSAFRWNGRHVRVSFTEDPWAEIDPCKRLSLSLHLPLEKGSNLLRKKHRDFRQLEKRKVVYEFPFNEQGTVVVKKGDRYFAEGVEFGKINASFSGLKCRLFMRRDAWSKS